MLEGGSLKTYHFNFKEAVFLSDPKPPRFPFYFRELKIYISGLDK
jgi:hypothetical protein